MKANIKALTVAAAVLLLASPVSAGESSRHRSVTPPTARVVGIVDVIADVQHEAGGVRVPLVVDLSGVTLESVPAVLGAYLVKATFDPAKLRYVRVSGGSTPQFMEPPTATNVIRANAEGWVKITAAQSDRYAPVGKVSIASLEFQEIVPGGASSIVVRIESAAAATTPDSQGNLPKSIELPVAKR